MCGAVACVFASQLMGRKKNSFGPKKIVEKEFRFFIICVQDGPPIRLWTEIGDEATWFMSTLDAISSSHFSKQF